MLRLYFTDHAIRQYRSRWAPDYTMDAAKRNLEELAVNAERLKERTYTGEELWQVSVPPLRLVVAVGDNQRVCKTVLPAGATFGVRATGDETTEEVMAAYQRAQPLPRPSTPSSQANGVNSAKRQEQQEREIANLKARCERLEGELRAAREALHETRCALGQEQVEPSNRARHERDQAIAQLNAVRRKWEIQRAHSQLMSSDCNAARKIVRASMPILVALDTPQARAVVNLAQETDARLMRPEAWINLLDIPTNDQ